MYAFGINDYEIALLHPEVIDITRYLAADGYAYFAIKETSVDQTSFIWQEMAKDWEVIFYLLAGTRGMRVAGEKFLPPFTKESPGDYSYRLQTSFLIDFLDDTLDEMVSKPFSKAISFDGTVPGWVEDFNKDVDGRGTTIHEFAKDFLLDAMRWGKSHAVVDALGMPDVIPEGALVGDLDGARPRVRLVPGPNVINWKVGPGRELLEARYYERSVEQDFREHIHVLTADSATTWSRGLTDATFKRGSEVRHQIGEVPLVTLYTKKTGELAARPPFMDLAWVSVDHWQSYSDQRHILHVVRVPILVQKGVDPTEIKKEGMPIGAKRTVRSTNPDFDMRYVEAGGSAMNEGREHLKMLAEAAKEKGAKPLRALSPVTATGEIRADSKATCDLQAWAEGEDRALLRLYQLAQRSVPGLQELPEDFAPHVHTDFDLQDRSGVDLAGLRQDRDRGDISREALIEALKSRKVLPDSYDAVKDGAKCDAERARAMEAEVEMHRATNEAKP